MRSSMSRGVVLFLAVLSVFGVAGPATAAPEGTMTWGVHITLASRWLDLPDQWDPKSPWHDRRVRQAASHAIDRQALNQAETLGFSKPTGSLIPRALEFSRFFEPDAFDPAKAKRLLAEAGYPNGFDAGAL